MDRVEKRLDATLKIVQTGMKMLVRLEQSVHAVIDAQMRTEANLATLTDTVTVLSTRVDQLSLKIDRLVDSLGRNGFNGRGRKH